MTTVPNVAPTALIAGNSASWTFSHPDYPAPTFTPSYAFIGIDKPVWDPSWVTVVGTGWLITIPFASTEQWRAGTYDVIRTVTDGTTKKSEQLAPMVVSANPANLSAGETRIAGLEADLRAVNAAISARVSGDQPEEYSLGGMQVRKMSLESLRAHRASLQNSLWKANNPGMTRTRVIRFTQPSP